MTHFDEIPEQRRNGVTTVRWSSIGIFLIALASLLMVLRPATAQAAVNRGDVRNGLIALTLRDAQGRLQIFTIRPDGTDLKQLTFEWDNGRPDWSPDGTKIAYSTTTTQGRQVFASVMDADGSNKRILTEGEAPAWSPDGGTIAFSRNWNIWAIDADGRNERQISRTPTAKKGPSWSPDGRQMTFILIRNPMSPTNPHPQIGIMNADGTNERILTREARTNLRINPDGTTTVLETAHDANAPSWSPVSDDIAFWSGIENRNGQIWVARADGTGARQLTDDPTHRNNDDPTWSPDGTKIIFSTGRSGKNELWMMDRDGRNQRGIHDIDAFPFPGRASWQPVPATRAFGAR